MQDSDIFFSVEKDKRWNYNRLTSTRWLNLPISVYNTVFVVIIINMFSYFEFGTF